MKNNLYTTIFFIILIIIGMFGYNKYYNSAASYTKRLNQTIAYWEKLVPDAHVNSIIKKYGQPISHDTKKTSRNPDKTDQYDMVHLLKYKDIDITVTNGADGYNMVTSVSIKTKKVRIKYGLHIGVKTEKVIRVLGQPFDKQIFGQAKVFTYIPVYKQNQYGQMLGYVEFILTDDILTEINWVTIVDD